MRFLLVATCLLAVMLTFASAEEVEQNFYEYENVVIGGPVTITGPGSAKVRIALPEGVGGYMGTPMLRSCRRLGVEEKIEVDEDTVFIVVARYPDQYYVNVVIGDRRVGRTQTYCPRLPYTNGGYTHPE